MRITRRAFLATAACAYAQRTDLAYLPLARAAELVRTRRVSPVELTQACLERIEKYQSTLNAFITITPERALAQARAAEAAIRAGRYKGPLHGIPLALKDNIDTAEVRTTGASNVFRDRVPAASATVVQRLEAAGAVFLGKLNLHEFAYGGTSAVTAFGAVRNPWNREFTPGGSSGGPGVAVAAGMCFGSLGTDTAGSVRIPASYCGITGLKPTYGRVSLQGVIPLSWSLDHVGPMTRTVEDTALMMNVIAGYDASDLTSVDTPVPDYLRALKTSVAKLRIGVPRAPFFDAMHPDVAREIDTALGILKTFTASMKDVTVPPATTGPLLGAEAYVYHAPYFAKSPDLYQPNTRAALQRASETKSEPYIKALRELAQTRRDAKKLFSDVDVLVLPTMAEPPLRVEEGVARNVSARNTSIFDAYGIPMISIPCGFTSNGFPVGMQIGAAPWAESTVLALAHAFQLATNWHTRRPPLP